MESREGVSADGTVVLTSELVSLSSKRETIRLWLRGKDCRKLLIQTQIGYRKIILAGDPALETFVGVNRITQCSRIIHNPHILPSYRLFVFGVSNASGSLLNLISSA